MAGPKIPAPPANGRRDHPMKPIKGKKLQIMKKRVKRR